MKETYGTDLLIKMIKEVESGCVISTLPTQFSVESIYSPEFSEVVGDFDFELFNSVERAGEELSDSEYVLKSKDIDISILFQIIESKGLVIVTISKDMKFLKSLMTKNK